MKTLGSGSDQRPVQRSRRRARGSARIPCWTAALLASLLAETTGAQQFELDAEPVANGIDGVWQLLAADLDDDGDPDVLAAGLDGPLSWFENLDAQGTFGQVHPLPLTGHHALVGDVDGDGDLDALAYGGYGVPLAWSENLDGEGTFGPSVSILPEADCAAAGDLDGDGDLDLVVGVPVSGTSVSEVFWLENADGQGAFAGSVPITSLVQVQTRWAAPCDVDSDGDLDVLLAYDGFWSRLHWYENLDGLGSFGPPQLVSEAFGSAGFEEAAIGDIDSDGDPDVAVARAHQLDWFENTDGGGSFALGGSTAIDSFNTFSVLIFDVDGDSDLDIYSTEGEYHYPPAPYGSYSGGRILWHENLDGAGAFDQHEVLTLSGEVINSGVAADMDGDGDLDVVGSVPELGQVVWHANKQHHDSVAFGPEQVITATADYAFAVFAADLDGDGDLDALSASAQDDTVGWYENSDGLGTFGPRTAISTTADYVLSVFAADLDQDGDQDVLSASLSDDKVAWYANDGSGGFGGQQVVTTGADGAHSVYAADMDGDGDLDILSAAALGDEVAWHENTNGLGSFGSAVLLSTSADGARSARATDLDGDGDLDVLATSSYDDTVAWYENTDGVGSFGVEQVLTTTADYAFTALGADLDSDGDQDVVFASEADSTIGWFENTDGLGHFGPELVISNESVRPRSLAIADLDLDGDLEVVAASLNDDVIAWFENTDAQGTFGQRQIISSNADWAGSVFAGDIDRDGDFDVLSASMNDDKVAWYENLLQDGSACGPSVLALEIVRVGSPPNPLAFHEGMTSGPVLGAVWDPWIEHETFAPTAIADFLLLTGGPINVPLGIGTLLCNPVQNPVKLITNAGAPGSPFQISIPGNCPLVGITLYTQGGSILPSSTTPLANALDITIGTY